VQDAGGARVFLEHPAHQGGRDAQDGGGLAGGCGRRPGIAQEQGRLANERARLGYEGHGGAVLARIERDGAARHHVGAVGALAFPEQDLAGPQGARFGREGDQPDGIRLEQPDQGRPRQDGDVVLEGHVPL
jgi:hypothetical protein